MASLLNPFLRGLDANANAVSGAKLSLFEGGTTTPVTTYSDLGLTTAQTHPLIANAAGEFEGVFVASGTYKIRVEDASNALLYENDYVRMADRPDDPIFFNTVADALSSTDTYVTGTYIKTILEGQVFKAAASGATDHSDTNGGGQKLYRIGGEYENPAALLGSEEAARGAGSIWRAGEFVYTEALAAVTDHHVTTAGGVQLYVEPENSGFNALAFGVTGDGATNDTVAIQAAVDAASGRPLHFPAGEYVIETTVNMQSGSSDTFNQGPQIIGDGIGKTVFNNRVSSGAMFDVSSGGTPGTNFLMGAVFRGFRIERTATETGQIGILLDTSYMVEIEQVHIRNLSGDGIRIPCALGDNDGSNMVNMKQVRIEGCTGWGFDAKGDSGFNETSFIYMEQVFIQACGAASEAYQPPSGGMRWKGQILTMQGCAFTLNENCAFWIPGEAGLGQTVVLNGTTFENNKRRHIFSRGISAFTARNIQLYSNNDFTVTNAIEFEAGSYTVRNVDIDGVVVRATSGNSGYTAFKISGANLEVGTCRVRNVVYDEWGHAGQTAQSGFADDPFVSAHKTAVQSVFSSVSAIIFDSEQSDEQLRYNPTTGRYTIPYKGWANFSGQITITGLTAGDQVTMYLYGTTEAANKGKIVRVASGATDETFLFNFTAEIGVDFTTRDYEIRVEQNSASGSKALNVSDPLNNTLVVRPVSTGEIL